jgi:chromosome segregation ATPase
MTNNYNDVIVEMTKNYNDVVAKLTEEANRDLAGELDTAIKAKEAAEADKKAAETDKHAAEAGKTAAEARIRVFENGFMKFDEERVNFENRIAEMDLKYDNLMAQHEQMVGIANEMYMTKTKEIEALNFEAQTYMTKTKEIEDLNFEVAALQAINKQLNVPGEAEIQHLREVVRERDMELAAIKPKLQHAIIAQNTLSKQLKKGGHDEEDWDNLHDNLKLIRRQNGEMKAKISEITKQHSDLSQNFKKASEKAKTATTLADQLKDQLRRANDQIEELEYDEEAALSIFTKSKPENRGRSPITGLLFSEPQTPADKLPGQLRLPPLLRNGPFGFPLAPESILPPRVKGKIPGLFALPPASPPMPDARMDIERAPAVGVAAQTPHIKDDFVPLPSSFVPLEQFFQSAEDEGPVVPASHKRRRARGL